jgi:hypothetical protein
MAVTDPIRFQAISVKSLHRIKDPSKAKMPHQPNWTRLNEFPKNHIKAVVPEYIVKKDLEACQTILQRLTDEQ